MSESMSIAPAVMSVFVGPSLVGLLRADQIAADRNQRTATIRPQRRNDIGGARAPIEPADHRPPYFQRPSAR